MINLAGKAPSSILSKVSNATSVLEAMQIANPYLADGTGGTGSGDEQYEALNKDLTKEVQNLFDGDYGTEGAREKLIAKLQTFARINYPELVAEIPKMVYGTDGYEAILPDGYEAELTKSTPFSGIPSFEDIQ